MDLGVIGAAIDLAEKLRLAARSGAALRLTPNQVAILMHPQIYGFISELEAKEIRRTCPIETVSHEDISSEPSGSGSGETALLGAFAGLKLTQVEASRGASLRLREEAERCRRQRKL